MAHFSATDELTFFTASLAGQYDVEREIGRGGMGVVYLARDLRLDRLVAIKTLPAHLAGDSDVRERFLREARTAARLAHANIVPIHRADEIGGQVFFVMGYVDGDSLAAKLGGGALSPRDAVPVLRDVANALGYAHKHGVVHRDVKTENILLDSASGRAMVTDFGIARVTEAAPLTATGQVLGTVYYLSPEQVSGEPLDGRSDIYSLGVVAYATLSGKFPFDGPLASAVLVAHVTKQPPPLAVAAPHVPASLAIIVDRCLAKDPADRFQSCVDLDAALGAAQADANRVATVPHRSPTLLISDSEAQAVFKRAAELQDFTGAQPRPAAPPVRRDARVDSLRSEGFKTANLREAAAEAGIAPAFVERALAEQGFRPLPARDDRPDRRAANVVIDVTPKSRFYQPEATETHYEMVFNGEVPNDDYDILIDTIKQSWQAAGMGSTVGRNLTWQGTTPRGRVLQVSVTPRSGRTTISVHESFRKVTNAIYGTTIGALGFGLGGIMAGGAMSDGEPAAAIGVLSTMLVVSAIVALSAVKGFAERRQKALRRLTEDLGAQTRESIEAKYIK